MPGVWETLHSETGLLKVLTIFSKLKSQPALFNMSIILLLYGSLGMVTGVSMSELLRDLMVEVFGELAQSKRLSSCNTGGGVSA